MPDISNCSFSWFSFPDGKSQLQVNTLSICIVRKPAEDAHFPRWLEASMAKINTFAMPINCRGLEYSCDPGVFHCLPLLLYECLLCGRVKIPRKILLFSCFMCYKIHILRFLSFSSYWKLAMWGCNKSHCLIISWHLYGGWGGIELLETWCFRAAKVSVFFPRYFKG